MADSCKSSGGAGSQEAAELRLQQVGTAGEGLIEDARFNSSMKDAEDKVKEALEPIGYSIAKQRLDLNGYKVVWNQMRKQPKNSESEVVVEQK